MADDKKDQNDTLPGGLLRKVDREQGYKKAAEFIMLLEKSRAAKVLTQLSDEEVEGIIGEITRMKNIDPAESGKIAAEFGVPELKRQVSGEKTVVPAGFDTAREILEAAFGEERSRRIMAKIERPPVPRPFSFLNETDPEIVSSLLKDESPQVISLVLAHLDSAVASSVIRSLPVETQREAAKRIAQMGKVLPDVVRRTADELKKKLFQQSDFSTQTIDGKAALREILRNMDLGQEQSILDELSEEKPELADELEKELFTMEIFNKIGTKDLQRFLREISDRDFAMSLKGENPELKELLLTAVSTRRKVRILEESDMLGEVPKKEAGKIKSMILGAVKTKIRAGEISLSDGKDILVQ